MAKVFDYLEDLSGDLIIRDGDFALIESTAQHQKDLLVSEKGQYKAFPTVGVGIDGWLNDDVNLIELEKAVISEFENDGMRVGQINIREIDNALINAEYIADGTQVGIR